MRAFILLTALGVATAACAVSPEVTLLPPDAQDGTIDAPGPDIDASGPPPDAPGPDIDASGPPPDADTGTRLLGWPDAFRETQTQIPAGTLFAFKLPPIESPVSLLAWGIIPDGPSDALVRMALYSDRAGSPAELVNWTEEWPAVNGEQTGGGAPLTPGVYWLVLIANIDIPVGNDPAQTVEACPRAFSFDQPFETSYGATASCSLLSPVNVYIVVRDDS